MAAVVTAWTRTAAARPSTRRAVVASAGELWAAPEALDLACRRRRTATTSARPRRDRGRPGGGGRQAAGALGRRGQGAGRGGARRRGRPVGVPQPPLGRRLPHAAPADRGGRARAADPRRVALRALAARGRRRRWRELADPAEGGGLLADLGSHLIDQAIVLFGRPVAVHAEPGAPPCAQVDDDCFVALTHPGGERSHLGQHARSRRPPASPRGWAASGSSAASTSRRPRCGRARGGGPGWGAEPEEAWGRLYDGAGSRAVPTEPGDYPAFYAGMARALRGGSAAGGPDAVAVLGVRQDARRSCRAPHPARVTSWRSLHSLPSDPRQADSGQGPVRAGDKGAYVFRWTTGRACLALVVAGGLASD